MTLTRILVWREPEGTIPCCIGDDLFVYSLARNPLPLCLQAKESTVKRFDDLFAELKQKAARQDPESGTVKELNRGKHFIGKKVIEEAGEVWMAAEYEGREKTAEEISQLLYHLQVMMIACDLELEDVYRYL